MMEGMAKGRGLWVGAGKAKLLAGAGWGRDMGRKSSASRTGRIKAHRATLAGLRILRAKWERCLQTLAEDPG